LLVPDIASGHSDVSRRPPPRNSKLDLSEDIHAIAVFLVIVAMLPDLYVAAKIVGLPVYWVLVETAPAKHHSGDYNYFRSWSTSQ
jgi:hypothetical protein